MDSASSEYAHLPDELLESILGSTSSTVSTVKSYANVNLGLIDRSRQILKTKNLLRKLSDGSQLESIAAVDGGYAVERLPEMDIALVQASGVEGLGQVESPGWGPNRHQYTSWQAALPHSGSNDVLVRGLMAVMEILTLAHSEHEVCILDGSHYSFAIALDRLFTISHAGSGVSVSRTVDDFLVANDSSLAILPSLVRKVMQNDHIVASTKYSSARALVEGPLREFGFRMDDKSVLMKILKGGEYTEPLRVVNQDRLRVNYNVDEVNIPKAEFEWLMNEAIAGLKTRDINRLSKQSEIFYMYYRPVDYGPVYRLEIKESLAQDTDRLQSTLRTIKHQVVFPDIVEPYPQYLADLIAKSVSRGMSAVRSAVVLSEDIVDVQQNISILRGYRT